MRLARVLTVLSLAMILSGSSFIAGYVSGTRASPIAASIVAAPPFVSVTWQRQDQPPTAAGNTTDDLDILREAWRLVDEEFYNRSSVDHQKMMYGAIRGMLATLDDPHTTFADPERARASAEEMRGAFEGIGVTVDTKDDRLTIVSPIAESPAERAGLRSGDVILEADGRSLVDVSMTDAIALIRGPAGTSVTLLIERRDPEEEGPPRHFAVTVKRKRIRMVNVTSRMLSDGIAYVKLNTFSAPAGRDLANVLQKVRSDNLRGIVFDLRNNPGGLLHSAVDVTSQFLSDGVVMYEVRRSTEPQPFYVRPGGAATDIPLVVLINGGSASASEIVAGALQDHQRAILIGERTYGKDSVQNIHQLPDRSSLRVTFARWQTPQRQAISQNGLTPDLVVPVTEDDSRSQRDPQLDRAISYLRAGHQTATTAPAGATAP